MATQVNPESKQVPFMPPCGHVVGNAVCDFSVTHQLSDGIPLKGSPSQGFAQHLALSRPRSSLSPGGTCPVPLRFNGACEGH